MAGLFVKLARRDGVAWTVEDGRRSVSLDCSEGVRLVVRYDSGEAQLAFDVLDPAVQKSICLLEGFPKIIIETPSDRSSAIELTVLSGQVPAQLPIQIRERADSMRRPCLPNSMTGYHACLEPQQSQSTCEACPVTVSPPLLTKPLFMNESAAWTPTHNFGSSATTSTRSGPRSPWNNALVNARTNAGEPPSACLRDCVVDQTRDLRPVGAASSHGVCQSAMRPLLRHGWRAGRHAMMMMSGSAPAPVRAAGGGASPVKHWDDLRHRVMNDMGAMDPATLAQYVHVLASAQELNPQVLDAVGAHVSTSSLELLTPTAIAKILDAFGRYRHRHRDLFRAASHQILVAPGLSAKDALLIVNSCSRTGHKDAQLFECVARCLVGEVDHMQQADLCKCAWAFAKSGLLACLDTGPALLNAVLDRCLVLFHDPEKTTCFLKSNLLADLTWAMAVVASDIDRNTDCAKLVALVTRFLRPQLASLSPHSLSSLIWAIASTQAVTDDTSLFDHIGRLAEQAVPTMRSNASLATIAWSFAKLDIRHNGFFRAVTSLSPERWKLFRASDLNIMAWALSRSRPERAEQALGHIADCAVQCLSTFKNSELCGVLWSCTKVKPHDALLDAAATFLVPIVGFLSGQELATTIASFLKSPSNECRRRVLVELLDRAQRDIDKLSPNDLAMTIRAVGEAPDMVRFRAEVLERAVAFLMQKDPAFYASMWPCALADIAIGLAKSRRHIHQVFSAIAVPCAAKITGFTPDALVGAIDAFSVARIDHSKFMSKAGDRVAQIADQLSPAQLSIVMTALAQSMFFRDPDDPSFGAVLSALSTRLTSLTPVELMRVAWAICVVHPSRRQPASLDTFWSEAGPIIGGIGADDLTDPDDIERLNVIRRDRADQLGPGVIGSPGDVVFDASDTNSVWRQEIASILEYLQYNVKLSVQCEGSGYAIDVAIPSKRIGILLEGDEACGQLCHQPTGRTVMRRRLVARAGWRVIAMPSWKWAAQTDPELARSCLVKCIYDVL